MSFKMSVTKVFLLLLILLIVYFTQGKGKSLIVHKATGILANAELISFQSLQAQIDSTTIEEKATRLSQNVELEDSASRSTFFKSFPASFREFKMIFGYYGKLDEFGLPENFGLLYESSLTYIDAFFNGLDVSDETLAHRVIDISSESEWQADGVSIFQDHLRVFTEKNLEIIVKVLKGRDEKQIREFWRFCYAGPHPESHRVFFEKVQSRVVSINPYIGSLLREEYLELLDEVDNHGR